jgi:hypothetical protein
MKAQIGAVVFIFSAALWLIAADLGGSKLDGLSVHEWGTFTSIAGQDGYPVDWNNLASDDLPKFVESAGLDCFKWSLHGTVRMETPVLYFYSGRELTAEVRVQFPHGAMTEWYPKADTAIYESKSELDRFPSPGSYSAAGIYALKDLIAKPPADLDPQMVRLAMNRNSIDTSMRTLMGSISWNAIQVHPRAAESFPKEAQASRYYAARETDAAPLTVGDQHEKFLFYRGVGRFPIPLTARIGSDGKVAVTNVSSETVPNVIFFENRGGKIGYRNAGSLKDEVRLDSPALNASVTALRHELESTLVAQGLYPKEAHAMIETWQDSWFEEGTRVIYLVPAATVNNALHLQINPVPDKTARVFVGRIELLTPDMKQTIQDAVTNQDFASAQRYGRFLTSWLDRIYPASTPAVKAFLAKLPRSSQGCQ